LFGRDRALLAQNFDSGGLTVRGEPIPVLDDPIAVFGTAGITAENRYFSVSNSGMLSYLPGSAAETRLAWRERSGRLIETVGPAGWYEHIELSPDASRVATDRRDTQSGRGDIYLLDLRDGNPVRFTLQPFRLFMYPRWSPDGQRLVFSGAGPSGLYVKSATGAGTEERVHEPTDGARVFPSDWSPDGRFVVFRRLLPGTTGELWTLSLDDGKAGPVPQAENRGTNGRFSPNGRWLAYQSAETGNAEVYVQSFPPTPGKWLISRDGGIRPRWRRDGRELYYIAGNAAGGSLTAVAVIDGATWRTGPQSRLFDIRSATTAANTYPYDVSPDGQRFLVIMPPEEAEIPITVVLNWESALVK
jgi:dipeptidyl aminopeptidase/acylaminoacyl peptidase